MASVYPTGSIISIGNTHLSTVPPGFLLCDGREVSRSLYFRLFDVIGTTYGVGDNSTTFNLPDLRDSFMKGVSVSVMQSDAGNYEDSTVSFLGGVFNYDLGINVSQSTYRNLSGISTTNSFQFSGTSNSAGEHSHSYYFNLDNADWGAGCKNDSIDNLTPPNRNAQQGRIWNAGEGLYVNSDWNLYHDTGGKNSSESNQFGHANRADVFTHTCLNSQVQSNSQNKCVSDSGTGNKQCNTQQIIIGKSEFGNGKSQTTERRGDHKHVVLRYFQLQQGNRISWSDPGFGDAVGNGNFDESWASERVTYIRDAHNHSSSLSITPQSGINHDLLNDHSFAIDPVQTSFVVSPGYPGAGTQNSSGQTAPSAIALGWAIKY